MANHDLSVYSAADLGWANPFTPGTTGGTWTVSSTGLPDIITISDDDPFFEDGPFGGSASADTNQLVVGNFFLDGVLLYASGTPIYNIASYSAINNTTGETGTVYLIGDTVATGQALFSTIELNPGDSVTYGPINAFVVPTPWDSLICFVKGTHIRTLEGEKRVEDLRLGDLVETLDHGADPIRWIGSQKHTGLELIEQPKLRPFRILKDTLASGFPPARDLQVSR